GHVHASARPRTLHIAGHGTSAARPNRGHRFRYRLLHRPISASPLHRTVPFKSEDSTPRGEPVETAGTPSDTYRRVSTENFPFRISHATAAPTLTGSAPQFAWRQSITW